MIDAYTDRFDHPYLLALVPVAGVLLGLSAVAEIAGINSVAGFLALYAMVALIICVIGYAALYTLAYSTEVLRQWRISRSDLE
ncbi:hypothetical protein [Natronorubrum texcoconense]|uniref:Uncharacterized protein n=1 Tax=Natronorubrum texcoconense TaxID=1095776 RepID=A0A1G9CU30_9EURY|nr:hypothetical protein [Natronorubrum texcoconense]SDK55190.1 hypothetical protein SAMN04515672_3311 [Natronorubrum texcoconense]